MELEISLSTYHRKVKWDFMRYFVKSFPLDHHCLKRSKIDPYSIKEGV